MAISWVSCGLSSSMKRGLISFVEPVLTTGVVVELQVRVQSLRKLQAHFPPVVLCYPNSEVFSCQISQYAEQALHIICGGCKWMLWLLMRTDVPSSNPFPAFNVSNQGDDSYPEFRWSAYMIKCKLQFWGRG